MDRKVTILMYHYVKDLKHDRYSEIKGLDYKLFYEQIKYLKKHYCFITMEMLIESINSNVKLPEKSVLLTFDDAYSDHFKYVFPFLDKNNIQGSFYVPVKAISEHIVLDVNKIHYIIASESNKSRIINEIKVQLDDHTDEYKLKSFSYYYDKLANSSFNRFDNDDVRFIKLMLQVELEESLRKKITNILFDKIVGIDEKSFSKELYMDIQQIECMNRNKMHFGSHGYEHYWLGSLDKDRQKLEILKSLDFLKIIGSDLNKWTMCYPYGSYNNSTLELLKEFNCQLAFTTQIDVANLNHNDKYELPRLNTNDIPKNEFERPNEWFFKG